MPPRYLRRASPTRLKPCQERTFEACDTTSHDGCCGATPCRLCLEWETYEDGIAYGSAEFATSSWTGTVGGGSFVAYWERNTYDECEFVVTFDGDEVYRATCYEGASCRNPAGEVAASIGYEEGTLRWSVYEPRELALIDDPETGCRDFFCDNCRCTCESLCVELIDSFGALIPGELINVSYPCDSPVWEGTVGGRYLSIALGRDIEGRCIITPTIDGQEEDAVFAPGCASMSAVIDLYGIEQITVRCKECSCDDPLPFLCECRLDADHTCIGTVVSGATVCTVSPTACGPLTFGSPVGVSAPNKAWLDTWCRYHGLATYKLTAFPPDCIDAATPKRIVFVKKTTDEDAPWVDDTIVGVEDWYAVVYDTPEGTPTIFYEYSQCCLGASTTTGASSHLIRVTFSNLNLGGMIYDFVILNPTTLAAYGDCE